MRKQAVFMTAGWFAAAIATTAVGVTAIDTLGAGLLSGSGTDAPLTESEVQRRLASESPSPAASATSAAPPTTPPTTAPTRTNGVVARALPTPGGTVHATCSGGLASLTAWSPAQGFRADDPVRGPAAAVTIKFKKDRNEMTIVVRCVNGEPTAQVIPDDD